MKHICTDCKKILVPSERKQGKRNLILCQCDFKREKKDKPKFMTVDLLIPNSIVKDVQKRELLAWARGTEVNYQEALIN